MVALFPLKEKLCYVDDSVVISNYSWFITCCVGLLLIFNQEAKAGETASSGEYLPGNRFTGAGPRETGRETQTYSPYTQAQTVCYLPVGRN